MGFFTPAQLAQAQGLKVGFALFAHMDFLSTPMYLWEGDGPLSRTSPLTGLSVDWEGLYNNPLLNISGLTTSVDGAATPLDITLSGVDARIINAAMEDDTSGEIEGRRIQIWVGFFQQDDITLTPLGNLASIGVWIMQRPTFDYSDVGNRSISMTCETLFAQRDRSVLGMRSDRDQNRRWAGDTFFDKMAQIKNRIVAWPRY